MSRAFKFGFGNDEDTEKDTLDEDAESQGATNPSAEEVLPILSRPCLHNLDDLVSRLSTLLLGVHTNRQNRSRFKMFKMVGV